ncbi:hypothetical protein HPB52_002900 [Rhipicephalus sanguineus]|uniref:Caspase family p20 domain-containing protein n=1 Tax=Rhipicephalus sanguineus TaxID=34632 RepID=A0A9D4SVJ6_RHISA|nr:hypothetical protein HPB52_002900 [Rhipicephalus sanguineus]
MFQIVNLLMENTRPAPPTSAVGPRSPRCHRPLGGSLVISDVHSAEDGHRTVGEPGACELRVVPAKEQKRGRHVYPMVHSPRGICLIINNHDFGDSKREGSEHDVRRMRYLFEALHFKCIVHWDLPESEMKKKVEEVAALKEHEVADCLVVILMSHGEQNMIYGVDRGKLHLENDIISLFDDENCPALRGKPKVFFIQACRAMEQKL